jgi:hypothetical protein
MAVKTLESLKGDVFIIPNSPASFGSESIKSYNLDFWADISTQYNILKWTTDKRSEFEGSEFENERFIELWFANESIDNWYDHGIDTDDGYHWRPMTKYLPETLFKGKKEGDEISFTMFFVSRTKDLELIKKVPVTLKLNQTSYRYKRFGAFEECLKNL